MTWRTWGGWLAALLVFAVSFELAARVEDWVRYDMPLDSPYRSEADLVVRDSLGMHGRADARYLKWSMNSLGLRGPEVSAKRPEGVLRVVAVGASEMFGQSESPDKEFPRQLEDSLRVRLDRVPGQPFRGVEVLNAAFFGMSLPTVIQDLHRRLIRFEPQVILLYPTTAQYLSSAVPRAAEPVAGGAPPPDPRWALHPRAFGRLREQLKRLAPSALRDWLWRREYAAATAKHPPGWRFDTVPADRIEAFEQDVRTFIGTARSAGAEPVLATHANRYTGNTSADSSLLAAWQRFYPRADGRVILKFDSAGALAIARAAGDSSVAVADVRASLSGCLGCFADYAHFTDEGAARAAGRTADAILEAVSRP